MDRTPDYDSLEKVLELVDGSRVSHEFSAPHPDHPHIAVSVTPHARILTPVDISSQSVDYGPVVKAWLIAAPWVSARIDWVEDYRAACDRAAAMVLVEAGDASPAVVTEIRELAAKRDAAAHTVATLTESIADRVKEASGEGVPAVVLAEAAGVVRQRVYQILKAR